MTALSKKTVKKPNNSFFYDGANYNAALAFTAPHGALYPKMKMKIQSTSGMVQAIPGDWIIRVGKKFTVMSSAEYEAKYAA